jgi:selenocysteine lyase/cysteine desulfurase
VDVKAMKIDYLSADGHKWLLGPEGAGLFYCRQELIERTRPLMIGWMNVADPQNFSTYDYTLKHDAGRFECGSYNVPGLLALKVSLEMLKSLGHEFVGGRLRVLTDRLIEGLKRKGYNVVSPRDQDQWSGIVSFTTNKHSHPGIVSALRKEHRVEMAVRDGRIRCSPHFYNTEAQIDRLLGLLPDH